HIRHNGLSVREELLLLGLESLARNRISCSDVRSECAERIEDSLVVAAENELSSVRCHHLTTGRREHGPAREKFSSLFRPGVIRHYATSHQKLGRQVHNFVGQIAELYQRSMLKFATLPPTLPALRKQVRDQAADQQLKDGGE